MLLDDDERKYANLVKELDKSVYHLKRKIAERSLDDQDLYEPKRAHSEASASISSRQSIKDTRLMELARLEQLKLEQQYIRKKRQA